MLDLMVEDCMEGRRKKIRLAKQREIELRLQRQRDEKKTASFSNRHLLEQKRGIEQYYIYF